MNLVVLSYCNPLDCYVFRSLAAEQAIRGVLRIHWDGDSRGTSLWPKTLRRPLGRMYASLQRRVALWQHRRLTHYASQALFEDGRAELLPVPCWSILHSRVNHADTVDLVRALDADVLVVSHAPILKAAMFEAPRLATLNVHWGVAPRYRGEHTLFWPLYLRDYEHLGVTIHRIDRGIDTGPVLAQGRLPLEPGDDVRQLTVKAARQAAGLLCETLSAAAAGDPLVGRRLEGPSRLFLRRHKTILTDLRYAARRALGRAPVPSLPEKRTFYFSREAVPGNAELAVTSP
jgi:folate-dependent phosphoribosylglycinamide formyltransferase PurN